MMQKKLNEKRLEVAIRIFPTIQRNKPHVFNLEIANMSCAIAKRMIENCTEQIDVTNNLSDKKL